MSWETIIGLETHVQLRTKSKMFCGCSTAFGAPPNTQVCPVCLGLPGALPAANGAAIGLAVRGALALGCAVHPKSVFARKNYFYPDLPKGYQISQFDQPLATNGTLSFLSSERGVVNATIVRLHIEEDAGKSIHDRFAKATAVDLNRSGVPLIEIVGGPDLRSPAEARAYLQTLKQLLEYIGISDCDMEKGSLRVDANVSVRRAGETALSTRTEVKNINSFAFVEKALTVERDRQIALVESGGSVTQQTMLYDSKENGVRPQRSKEESHDYRYFPEPDLLPLVVDTKWQKEIRDTLPELPEARRKRMVANYGITEQDAQVLTLTKALADQFEAAAKVAKSPKRVANLVQSELMGRLKAKGLEIEQSPISMKGVAASADLVESGAISGKMLKDLYDLAFERGKDFSVVYEEQGRPEQSRDTSALERIIDEIIATNPRQVEQYRAGKKTVVKFFVGQVMQASKGQANPQLVNELLAKKLDG